jgi:hypothetical protein
MRVVMSDLVFESMTTIKSRDYVTRWIFGSDRFQILRIRQLGAQDVSIHPDDLSAKDMHKILEGGLIALYERLPEWDIMWREFRRSVEEWKRLKEGK